MGKIFAFFGTAVLETSLNTEESGHRVKVSKQITLKSVVHGAGEETIVAPSISKIKIDEFAILEAILVQMYGHFPESQCLQNVKEKIQNELRGKKFCPANYEFHTAKTSGSIR